MFRKSGLAIVFVLVAACSSLGQSVPKELLSAPARLVLDKPTMEVKPGSTVTYTVTLKNAQDQAVAAPDNMQLLVETPSGNRTVTLPAGQSSATFNWQAVDTGIVRMTVRSGKLYPASGLVLIAPSPRSVLMGLWVCKGIVEKHHGSIRVKSRTSPGKSGTVFSVFLPAVQPEVEALGQAS